MKESNIELLKHIADVEDSIDPNSFGKKKEVK